MRAQRLVAAFLDGRDLETDPAYRLLDLASEVGEVAGDAAKSSEYGADPDALAVADDELCDALLSLLALAESFDLDAEATLEVALDKYQRRIAQAGDASSDVEANDQTPITHEADDEEHETLLGEKLVEEAREFRESGDAEELADVLAVVDAVREHRDVSEVELRAVQAEKVAECGRFEERIVRRPAKVPESSRAASGQ
jgi:predicted house-cleaning noncanonical NTP pyrophosphatase (MazG superfamily)